MGVHIVHSLDELADDLAKIPAAFKSGGAAAVRDVARDGNRAGKSNARRTAGEHGKHYHKAFTAERLAPLTWEWGPDASMPQGGMSFERGSRNQPPHLDIAKAADIHGAGALARKVHDVFDKVFWL